MKTKGSTVKHLLLILPLLLAPLAAHAQQPASTVRDHLWLFACPPNADGAYLENAGIRGGSRMTPVEGAFWLGTPNLLFITQGYKRPRAMWYESKGKVKTTMEQWAIAFESVKPKTCRIALGIYLWDYTGIDPAKKDDPAYRRGQPVPLDLMEHHCGLGLKWLKEGQVSDLLILANTHLDLGINTAPWMREWIKKHGDEKLNR